MDARPTANARSVDFQSCPRCAFPPPTSPPATSRRRSTSSSRASRRGDRYQTLLGVTGTGKTFTMANVIAQVQKPTLVMAHNKTLAAQLYSEFQEFFPDNAVHYFVSYYDYYQPEAYIPQRDIYIEKDALDQRGDRAPPPRRDRAWSAARRDRRRQRLVHLRPRLARRLRKMMVLLRRSARRRPRRAAPQARRHPVRPQRRRARARQVPRPRRRGRALAGLRGGRPTGSSCSATRSRRSPFDPLTGEVLEEKDEMTIYPAKHFVTAEDRSSAPSSEIRQELEERLDELKDAGQAAGGPAAGAADRYDMEMLREVGYCSGIENYSRHPLGPQGRASRRTRCSTSSPTTSCCSSTSRT